MYYTNCAGARARTVTRTPQNIRTVRCADRTPKSGVRLFTSGKHTRKLPYPLHISIEYFFPKVIVLVFLNTFLSIGLTLCIYYLIFLIYTIIEPNAGPQPVDQMWWIRLSKNCMFLLRLNKEIDRFYMLK